MSQHTNERNGDGMPMQWAHRAGVPHYTVHEDGSITQQVNTTPPRVRMDAAEAAAEALSKWEHALPVYATDAREAVKVWRAVRGL